MSLKVIIQAKVFLTIKLSNKICYNECKIPNVLPARCGLNMQLRL